MKENEFPVLKILNVDWDENWDVKQVSNWISQKFDWVFHSVSIKQIGTWQEESG